MKYLTETREVEALLPVLMAKPAWGTDSESTGLDAHQDEILAVQLGRPDEQYVIDTRKTSIAPLRPFFESPAHLKIFHYAKHDYKMFRALGIFCEAVRCTLLGDKVLNVGRKKSGFALEAVAKDRLGVALDKSVRESFIGHRGDFSVKQLGYMAEDVKWLLPIMQHEVREMKTVGLVNTFRLECDAIPAFGDMEFDGIPIDVEAWKRVMEKQRRLADETKLELDRFVEPFCGDLFGGVDINYNSPQQIIKLLNMMRVKVPQYNRETRKEEMVAITTTNKNVLQKIQNVPFVRLLEKWRSLEKMVATFGQPYIDAIHPKTGRLHPDFDQLGAENGRPSSGRGINLLNIPRENDYRHAFTAGPNEVVESDDYRACEIVILADLSGDPGLREIFIQGKDPHCVVGTDIFRKEVTKTNENRMLRIPAKAINMGACYEMSATTICDRVNAQGFAMTRDEAKKAYEAWHHRYQRASRFLRENGRLAVRQGWLANINGRRRYWPQPDPKRYERGKFDPDYKAAVARIERQGSNFVISSVNADILKKAMSEVRQYIRKNGTRTHIMNAIYDELVTRTHGDDSLGFHDAKQRIMREAGEIWIRSIPVGVDGIVMPYWHKD